MNYKVSHPTKMVNCEIDLPSSKSISNRLLIIKALCKDNFEIENLSDADDTKILEQALNSSEEMIDVKTKSCNNEWCFTRGNLKYEGYCLYCFINTFPDKPNTRNYKTKKRSVVEYILENFPSFTWTSDKKVQDGCSKRRPDLLLDLGYQIIIIEVDENQHIDYDCSCENKRLMELSQDVGHRPIIFIRFNPDKYIDENGDDIASCWKITKPGLCIINSDARWNSRLNTLKNHVEYWSNITNKTDKTIEVIQLYYDLTSD